MSPHLTGNGIISIRTRSNLYSIKKIESLVGELPPWFHRVMGAIVSVALYKTEDKDASKVRPIGALHPLERFLKHQVVSHHKSAISEYLDPQQLGCSRASAHKLVHVIRMAVELRLPEGHVLVKLDFTNAHSEVSRASVLEEISKISSLQHLAQHLAVSLAPPTTLVSNR